MRRHLAILAVFCLLCATDARGQKRIVKEDFPADEVVNIWSNATAPHSNCETQDETIRKHRIGHTSYLDLYIFRADEKKNTGHCFVFLPGGSYRTVNVSSMLPLWLKKRGVTTVVVKYRLPNFGHGEASLEDGIEALRYMKQNAARYGIDPNKVGLSGSSAGGHLAAWVSNKAPEDARPAYCVLFYPATNKSGWWAGTTGNPRLMGNDLTPEMTREMDTHSMVTKDTPRTLLFLSDDDLVVPSMSSITYYEALKDHGVEASMHIYPSGGHGWEGKSTFKYRDDWMNLLWDFIMKYEDKK